MRSYKTYLTAKWNAYFDVVSITQLTLAAGLLCQENWNPQLIVLSLLKALYEYYVAIKAFKDFEPYGNTDIGRET